MYIKGVTRKCLHLRKDLDFVDFNSNQSIVYSACDILIRLRVEDSEYVIPKLVEVNPQTPTLGRGCP